jgi:uncharacterized membrane-anchored protein YjiN (DUF445 family)
MEKRRRPGQARKSAANAGDRPSASADDGGVARRNVVQHCVAPWTVWLKAFAEAAVVGAVADWFAVVALFRRPLGLPIAHTAIIPNNKDRIGESLGRFVEENFLTPENVMQRVAIVNLAKAGGTWLAEPDNSDRAAAGICAIVPRVLTMFQDEDVTRFLTSTLLGEFEKINLAPIGGEVLDVVSSSEQYQALFDDAVKGIERFIAANEALILEKFGETSKYTPAFSIATS